MRFILSLILLILIGFVAHQFLPWWSIVVLCTIAGVWTGFGIWKNFFLGLLAVALLWGGYAYWLNAENAGIIAERVAGLFGGGQTPGMLVAATALLGGLLGGLGTVAGGLWSRIFD